MAELNGYLGFYDGRQVEIWAENLFAAKQAALESFKPPRSTRHLVTVALCEKNGQPVVHVAVD